MSNNVENEEIESEDEFPKICAFCGNDKKIVGVLVEGEKLTEFFGRSVPVYICGQCIPTCEKALEASYGKTELEPIQLSDVPRPIDILEHLNQYVIGQTLSKRKLSVEVSSHFQRLASQNVNNLSEELNEVEIEKSNILLIGPTGSGKTLLAKSLAKKLNVPIAIGDATTLTEAGYVGEDVENLLLKLLVAADYDIELAQRGIIYIDEIDKLRKTGGNVSITRDVSGEGVQQSLLKLIEGTMANIPPQGGRKHPEQEYVQMDTTNILFICGGAFTGLDDIVRQRLNKRRMGFATASQEMVNKRLEMNDLLRQVIPQDLIEFGLIPEFIGRLPIIAPLEELSLDEMIAILTKPKNALLKQEQKKLALQGVNLIFTEDAVREIATQAMTNGTGARALRSIVASFMTDIHFDICDKHKNTKVVIDKDVVLRQKNPLIKQAKAA